MEERIETAYNEGTLKGRCAVKRIIKYLVLAAVARVSFIFVGSILGEAGQWIAFSILVIFAGALIYRDIRDYLAGRQIRREEDGRGTGTPKTG